MNTLLLTDFYKVGHIFQYPKNTTLVYSNFTARTSRIKGADKIVFFGLQYFIKKYLIEEFNKNFFHKPLEKVLEEYQRIIKNCLGQDIQSYEHIAALHSLGYLPIEIKALPEGSEVPIKVPMLTIQNTVLHQSISWLTNWVESLMSSILWQPITSATIAKKYKKIMQEYANKTCDNDAHIQFQCHDFSFRGMSSLESAVSSGMGHLTSFVGTDTIPAILGVEQYYNTSTHTALIGCSVPATEHSVMCAGGEVGEIETFKNLITKVYPNGIVSIVSDTWDLWKVCTEYLSILKNDVLARDGKVVIRPDSGNPADIICGKADASHINEQKCVVELLWDIFGGTVNNKGYKELDTHIGCIYGDSITPDVAIDILTRLEAKGFASNNIVFGIGSYTYQYNTRDTFGMAMKATYVEVDGVSHNIKKSPITDSGTKHSATGLLKVDKINGTFILQDACSKDEEAQGELKTVFKNGVLMQELTFSEIRAVIDKEKPL